MALLHLACVPAGAGEAAQAYQLALPRRGKCVKAPARLPGPRRRTACERGCCWSRRRTACWRWRRPTPASLLSTWCWPACAMTWQSRRGWRSAATGKPGGGVPLWLGQSSRACNFLTVFEALLARGRDRIGGEGREERACHCMPRGSDPSPLSRPVLPPTPDPSPLLALCLSQPQQAGAGRVLWPALGPH